MYDLNLVRLLAYDIAAQNPNIYTLNNAPGCLNEVPFNYYLHNIPQLETFCKDVLKSHNPDANLHVINDYYLEPSIVGGYFEYDNEYFIILNPNIKNTCWYRFAHVKELCSLYTNHYGRKRGGLVLHTFNNYQESIESAIKQKTLIDSNQLDTNDLESDTFAILLAAEVMIPPKKRKYTTTLFERVKNGEMKMNDVAQSLSMPEYMLQKSVDLNYYDGSSHFYEEQKVLAQ